MNLPARRVFMSDARLILAPGGANRYHTRPEEN